MSSVLLDASVAVSAVVPDDMTPASLAFLSKADALVVPDTFFAEVGNALYKRLRREDITPQDASDSLLWLGKLDIEVLETRPHIDEALWLAVAMRETVHDSLYVTLAKVLGVPLVTADRRLHGKAVAAGLEDSVLWIEEAAK